MLRFIKKLLIKNKFQIEGLILDSSFFIIFVLNIALFFALLNSFLVFVKIFPFLLILFLIREVFPIIKNSKTFLSEIKEKRLLYLALGILLILVIFNFYFFHVSSIEGGHDPGVYMSNAINLADKGTFIFDNPLRAGYPGYFLTNGDRIFSPASPGYSTILALGYSYFGFKGFPLINSILLFLSIALILCLLRKIVSSKGAFIFLFLFFFNFTTLWFSRQTYMESLYLFLLWLTIYLMLSNYSEKRSTYLIFLPILTLLLVRMEGIFYLVALVLALFLIKKLYYKRKEHILNFDLKGTNFYFFLFVILAILNYCIYLNFYNPDWLFGSSNVIKNIFFWIAVFFQNKEIIIPATDIHTSIPLFSIVHIYMIELFSGIGLLLILLLFLLRINKLKDKKLMAPLCVFLIPMFVALIWPSVQLKFPWFLRRFWPTLVPFIIFCFSLTFTKAKESNIQKKINAFIFFALIILFVSVSHNILFFSEGNNLFPQLKNISDKFSDKDLVIFYDKYGIENFAPTLNTFFNKSTIYWREPVTDEQLEIYFESEENYPNHFIVSPYSPYIISKYLPNKKLTLLETFNFSYPKIKESGVGIYIERPDLFKNYGQIVENVKSSFPPERVIYESKLNLYKVEN